MGPYTQLQTELNQNKQHFSRTPTLNLPLVATLILRGHILPRQNPLNKLFRELGTPELRLSDSAYCQARQKLWQELFAQLNTTAVEQCRGVVAGRRLLANPARAARVGR